MAGPEEAILDSDLLTDDSMRASKSKDDGDIHSDVDENMANAKSSIDFYELAWLLGNDSEPPLSGISSFSHYTIDSSNDMLSPSNMDRIHEDTLLFGIHGPENKESQVEPIANMQLLNGRNESTNASKEDYDENANSVANAASTRPEMLTDFSVTQKRVAASSSPPAATLNNYDDDRAAEEDTNTSSTMMILFNRKRDIDWNQKFSELKAFKARTGHTEVPQKYRPNPALGHWVARQRLFMREWEDNDIDNSHCMMLGKQKYDFSRMNIHNRMKLLKSIGFVPSMGKGSGSRNNQLWERSFTSLLEYKESNGDCNVPFKCTTHKSLGSWVAKQRIAYKQHAGNGIDQMPSNKRELQKRFKKLEGIGFKFRIGSGNRLRK